MLRRLDQVSETGKSVQKRHVECGFLAFLGRNRNGFRERAGSKSFFSSLLENAYSLVRKLSGGTADAGLLTYAIN